MCVCVWIMRSTQLPISSRSVLGHVMLYTANVCVRSHDRRPLELKGFPIMKQVYSQLSVHVKYTSRQMILSLTVVHTFVYNE